MEVPAGLDWWRDEPGGADWLRLLPRIIERCFERWQLRLQPGHDFGVRISCVLPVLQRDGGEAVLKINFPSVESDREAEALLAWGDGVCVRLLAHDFGDRALLLERCRPGNQLWSVEDDTAATRIAADVMLRLWRPPPAGHAFRLLRDEAARWLLSLPLDYERHGRPFERAILDEALYALGALGPYQGEQHVLHQDLHAGNIISAERAPWLVIDPKPLVGEREFDTASLLRDRRPLLMGDEGARIVRRRLDMLSNELGLDRERMRLWGIAHALAWGIDGEQPGTYSRQHVQAARLLHEAARP